MKELPPAILLMGPTASGKTAAALALSAEFDCEVVSVDSAMVYRGMDIGTAKPDAEEMGGIPHHLIDICDPVEEYSAARFRDDALTVMARVSGAGRVPLLAGGTLLYYRALERGLAELPTADPVLRQQLLQDAEASGWPALHQRLANLDPEAAARIDPNDRQRIQRALEVCLLSGSTRTALTQQQQSYQLPYRVIKLILAPDRATIHQRVEQRFDQMLQVGLVEEVRGLHRRSDLGPETPSMRAVGYRQIWSWLEGQYSFDEARFRAIVATRQLAKRQLTWLRREPDAIWFEAPGRGLIAAVQQFLDLTP
ncbi:MAG: tRNA (adenosine(37)-N6)-dimethylallyltransferase MiaA [Gammaproteobacteria bacterium]|nr:tRNA (adenosine(37)-N6)-dimethylallyltransferase MiaA [Gammaproteobacteria bacterium]